MLTFHHGVMGSGKSAFALMIAFEKHHPDSPSHPNRAVLATTMDRSAEMVTSRTGMAGQAMVVAPGSLTAGTFEGFDTVVIDEAQFLTATDVELLAEISAGGTEVICLGLRTDFTAHLFEGARRLLELAERIEPMAITPRCARCDRPAIINARLVDGEVTATGETVVLGDVARGSHLPQRVTYDPMCYGCWRRELSGGTGSARATERLVLDNIG